MLFVPPAAGSAVAEQFELTLIPPYRLYCTAATSLLLGTCNSLAFSSHFGQWCVSTAPATWRDSTKKEPKKRRGKDKELQDFQISDKRLMYDLCFWGSTANRIDTTPSEREPRLHGYMCGKWVSRVVLRRQVYSVAHGCVNVQWALSAEASKMRAFLNARVPE